MKSLLILFIFCFQVLTADSLYFKPHSPVTFFISQGVKSDGEMHDMMEHEEVESEIVLELTILEAGDKTPESPLIVEIIPRSLSYSSNPEQLAYILDELINEQLVFKIEGDFKVQELTGRLDHIFPHIGEELNEGFGGISTLFYELFLTQVFHLSGTDLETGSSFPLPLFDLLEMEEEGRGVARYLKKESFVYDVDTQHDEVISAFWKGEATFAEDRDWIEYLMAGSISVSGSAEWCRGDALLQRRCFSCAFTHDFRSELQAGGAMLLDQKWLSVPSHAGRELDLPR